MPLEESTKTIRIAINGAGGRMGRTLIEACQADDDLKVVAATARPGSASIGADAGETAGVGKLNLVIRPDPSSGGGHRDRSRAQHERGCESMS